MARRQLKYEFNTDEFKSNLNLITQAEVDEVAHPDTLAYIMKKINPEELSGLKTKMITRLIRMRCLEKYRLMDEFYMIAVDMTGHVYFGEQRHCDGCSIQKREGKVYYRHNVLEAKLVTRGGMALSIETEFVENKNENDKQDCELSAFYRLVKRLKDRFPQLRICLLMDSLYANQQTFNICKESGWKYIVTFKSGSMPKTYQEAMTIKRLQKKNRGIYEKNEIRQKYAWASEVEHEGHKTNILECVEHKEGRTKGKRFVWATNLWITKNNYAEIANDGGRCRWKIENEGFQYTKERRLQPETCILRPSRRNEEFLSTAPDRSLH